MKLATSLSFFLMTTLCFGADRKPASDAISVGFTHPVTIAWALSSNSVAFNSQTFVLGEKSPLFKMYISAMPEYQHQTFTANIPRIELELKNSAALVCFLGSSEDLRRRQFSYLTPQYVQPPPQLITRKDVADRLYKKHKNKIFLKDVLQDKTLSGIVGESRSFGNILDQVIRSTPENNLQTSAVDALGSNIVQMVNKRRADYTLEYQFVLNDLKNEGKAGDDVVAIPLADAGSYMVQYLACSKTPEGLAVIQRADKVIRENIHNAEYWQGVLKSVDKADLVSFQKEINKFVQARSQSSYIIK